VSQAVKEFRFVTRPPSFADDRYDAAHPESEHDGGLASGDWLKEREA